MFRILWIRSLSLFSSPGLSWDAMFKMTRIELEPISETDMHLFIEKGMRGGVSYMVKRHSKTNKKYMKCYASSEGSKFIMYYGCRQFIWLGNEPIFTI